MYYVSKRFCALNMEILPVETLFCIALLLFKSKSKQKIIQIKQAAPTAFSDTISGQDENTACKRRGVRPNPASKVATVLMLDR